MFGNQVTIRYLFLPANAGSFLDWSPSLSADYNSLFPALLTETKLRQRTSRISSFHLLGKADKISLLLRRCNKRHTDDIKQNEQKKNGNITEPRYNETNKGDCILSGTEMKAQYSIRAVPGAGINILCTFTHEGRGAGIAQWWEHAPSTGVAMVRFPDAASYVG